MEHKNDLLLAIAAVMTWLSTITSSQVIGLLTVLVLILTAWNKILSNKKLKAEIKRLEKNN